MNAPTLTPGFSNRMWLGLLALGLTIAACGSQADVAVSTQDSQAGEPALEEQVVDTTTTTDTTTTIEVATTTIEASTTSEVTTTTAGATTLVEPTTTTAEVTTTTQPATTTSAAAPTGPVSGEFVEFPSALPEVALAGVGDPIGFQPLSISLPTLGVDDAPIVPVGLEDNGELEVPEADTVGWYEFGAGVDGGQGSTVLAAHIAYNGENGVFRNLVDMEPGQRFSIERDGEQLEYIVESVTDYDKYELPIDDLFSESGDERLILITCGGSFNDALSSYEDNTVVVAIPA